MRCTDPTHVVLGPHGLREVMQQEPRNLYVAMLGGTVQRRLAVLKGVGEDCSE